MHSLDQLGSWDMFFEYGKNGTDLEIERDLIMGLIQPSKSLFGYRNYGAGVTTKENYPNSIAITIGIKYDIALHIAKQNLIVNTKDPDRRVAVSQNSIKIFQEGQNLNVSVLYIAYKDYKKSSTINLPVGVTK